MKWAFVTGVWVLNVLIVVALYRYYVAEPRRVYRSKHDDH
jgi:hypothetical protein